MSSTLRAGWAFSFCGDPAFQKQVRPSSSFQLEQLWTFRRALREKQFKAMEAEKQ